MVNQSLSFSLFIRTRAMRACISSLTLASHASLSRGPARVRNKGISWTSCLSKEGAAGGAGGPCGVMLLWAGGLDDNSDDDGGIGAASIAPAKDLS